MPLVGRVFRHSAGSHRTLLIAAACFVVLGLGLAMYATTAGDDPEAASSSPVPGGDSQEFSPSMSVEAGNGYLVSATELRERAQLAREGREPYRSAVDDLMVEADRALQRDPQPMNPLSHRNGRFLDDTRDAYTLALAWVVSGDERYARGSAAFIMAWVDGVDQTRDTCPQRGGSDCATSLIVSRNAPAFVFAADLLEGSGAIGADDDKRLKHWLAELILPAASERTNNWGDAGTFMRLCVADFIGDSAAFSAAVEDWRALMNLVTAEGEIPEETRRGSQGLLYTQGAISYKVASAVIAERRGIDLWTYEGTDGGTLRAAIDTFARYWEDPDAWPWHEGRLRIPSVDPAWEMIYHRWPEAAYARVFAAKRPLGIGNPSAIIWTTVTHGVPL